MRRALAFALLAAATVLANATADAQRRIVRAGPLDPTGAFRIHALSGSITVIGWDRDSVDVRGTVPMAASPVGGGTRAGWKMSVYDGFNDPGASGPSHLVAYVPRRAQVWIKVTSATVAARDLVGTVDLNSIEGAVELRGSPTALRIETMRGDVTVTGSPPWMRIRTGGGKASFTGSSDDAAIATISGDIMTKGQLRRGRLESLNGDVSVTGGLPPDATLDVDTHDGAVSLALDRPINAAFALFTVTGQVTNLLAPPDATGRKTREFSLGTGGARVTIRTFGGGIRLGQL